MNTTSRFLLSILAVLILALSTGCSGRDPSNLDQARASIDPKVFSNTLLGMPGDVEGDVYFQPFFETYYQTASIDSVYTFEGNGSLKMDIPGQGSALGAYAGGVLTSIGARDLADFNALTFYARASIPSAINELGFGNDNTGESKYSVGRSSVPVNPNWTLVVIPIPDSSKLIAERGLFTFAEGFEFSSTSGHSIWFDEIKFAQLGNITNPRPTMPSVNRDYFIGSSVSLNGTYTTYDIDGADVVVDHMPGYFEFASANPAVAVIEGEKIKIIGEGNTVVTAKLGDVDAEGLAILTGQTPPTEAAPAPTLPAGDVVSLFSSTYSDVGVDTWNTRWTYSTTDNAEYVVNGRTNLMYSSLNFVGIEFLNQTVDASQMTHFHLDVFAPAGSNFKVKLVAFDDDNGIVIGQSELSFDDTTTPAFTSGQWVSLDIPMEDFGFTADLSHMGQLVLSTDDAELVLVDNIYWHK